VRSHRRAALTALILVLPLGAAPAAPAATVGGARADVQRLEAELARLDAAAGEAAVAHNRAMDRLDAVRARIRVTKADLARNRVSQRIAQGRLADRLSALYRVRAPGLVEILLISGSLSDAVSARDLLGRIARSDAGLVRAVRERRARLAVLAARLRDQRAAARDEVRTAAARRAGLVALVDRRRTVLAGARVELRRALARRRAELARLAAAKRAVEAGRAAAPVPRGTQPAPSPLPAGTTHVFPVRGPTTYTDDWLAPRGSRYHEGIDLMAARGTPVVAVAAGTVFRVGASPLRASFRMTPGAS
jgi:murein DD-endopeptidase MepM/ murein hydrolase activator NlpD